MPSLNNHVQSLTSISCTTINSAFKSIVFFSAGNFAQKQEMENKQFAADENKTVCSKICICRKSFLNSLAICEDYFIKNATFHVDGDGGVND